MCRGLWRSVSCRAPMEAGGRWQQGSHHVCGEDGKRVVGWRGARVGPCPGGALGASAVKKVCGLCVPHAVSCGSRWLAAWFVSPRSGSQRLTGVSDSSPLNGPSCALIQRISLCCRAHGFALKVPALISCWPAQESSDMTVVKMKEAPS